MFEQIAFVIVLLTAGYFLYKRIAFIASNIRLGKHAHIKDHQSQRVRNLLLIAFGQKKMFKRPVPALLHLFLYVGFFVINIEVLEFIIDGVMGTHRVFAPLLGSFYTVLMNVFEFLAVAVLISCIIFLIRRNVLKLRRFEAYEMIR